MRSAGNFSPEWGYLAPAPSFALTARVVLVATAIGATAGAGVVLSLIDRPSEPEKTPVAARAIVTSVRAEAVPSAAPAVPTATPAAKPASPSRGSVAAAPPSAKPPAANAPAPTPAASAVLPNTAAPAAAPTTSAPPTAAVDAAGAADPASASASATAEPSNVADAAPDGATIMTSPEQAPPAKKTKHHASSYKNQFPGIGSFFRRAFASHGSRSYYPNSQ